MPKKKGRPKKSENASVQTYFEDEMMVQTVAIGDGSARVLAEQAPAEMKDNSGIILVRLEEKTPVHCDSEEKAPARRESWADQVAKEEAEVAASKIPKSYASVVKGNRDISQGWGLQYVKPTATKVEISAEEWEEGSKDWECCLVGYVPGCEPRFKDMVRFANSQWKKDTPQVLMLAKGVFLFSFLNAEAMQLILDKRWTFYGNPLILKPWTPYFDVDNLEMEKLPVWIQLPQLHLSLWNPTALRLLASWANLLQQISSQQGEIVWNTQELLVEMDIVDDLVTDIPVKLPRGEVMQPIVYEWKPVKCKKCARLGHRADSCNAPPVNVWITKPNQAPVVQEGAQSSGAAGNQKKGNDPPKARSPDASKAGQHANATKGGKPPTSATTQTIAAKTTAAITLQSAALAGDSEVRSGSSSSQLPTTVDVSKKVNGKDVVQKAGGGVVVTNG